MEVAHVQRVQRAEQRVLLRVEAAASKVDAAEEGHERTGWMLRGPTPGRLTQGLGDKGAGRRDQGRKGGRRETRKKVIMKGCRR